MTGAAQMLMARISRAVRKRGGRQPSGMTLTGLMEPFPVEWARQMLVLWRGD